MKRFLLFLSLFYAAVLAPTTAQASTCLMIAVSNSLSCSTFDNVPIGSTTPSTGSFTTVVASGTIAAQPAGSASAPSITFNGDATTGIYRTAAGTIAVSSSGSFIGQFQPTGLNYMAIGATSPNTGAFTTLTAKYLAGNGTTTFTAAAAAGSSPTVVCASGYVCDSISGTITLTTGTSPTTGTLVTVTLPLTRANSPSCVVNIKGVSSANYSDSETTSTVVFSVTSALAAGTAYKLTYVCGGV
jgi:hypothetical protein